MAVRFNAVSSDESRRQVYPGRWRDWGSKPEKVKTNVNLGVGSKDDPWEVKRDKPTEDLFSEQDLPQIEEEVDQDTVRMKASKWGSREELGDEASRLSALSIMQGVRTT